jgi:hypothetical protein
LSYISLDILFSTIEDRAAAENQILSGDFVLLEYAALEYLEHIKAWMKLKGPQDSAEGISAALSQLFETRENDTFEQSTPSESFMCQFAVFQDHPDLQHSLASAASFLTGAKLGMTAVDGKHGMGMEYLFKA